MSDAVPIITDPTAAFRAFADQEVAPLAGAMDDGGEFPRELVARLAALKFLGAPLPPSLGGLGLDPVTYGRLIEAISRHCANTRNVVLIQASIVGECFFRHGRPEQVARWWTHVAAGKKLGAFSITEPLTGSDARNIATRFERRGRQFALHGRKRFTTLGGIADFLLVAAKCDDQMAVFVVDRDAPGVAIRAIPGLLASRASHIAEIDFDGVVVDEGNLLGQPSTGICDVVATAFDSARYCVAWAAVGLAQGALEAMMRYSRKRVQFGKQIWTHQLVQEKICDATCAVRAARALCVSAGEMRRAGSGNAALEATVAKYYCSKEAMRIATDAVQVHGANGCTRAFPVERLFREAKLLEIMEGTTQVLQQVIVGKAMVAGV